MKAGPIIVLVMAIGAGAGWLWMNRGVEPSTGSKADPLSAAAEASTPPNVSGEPLEQPDTDGRGLSERGEAVPSPASSGAPPSIDATADARDDSTYFRMLATVQSLPRAAHMTRSITEIHERFLQSPDDPDWGRKTEKALRDFFRARSASGLITSVSCRSTGCEVQAEVQRPHVDVQAAIDAVDDPAEIERARKEPMAALREEFPLGKSLKLEAQVNWPSGARQGVIQFYRRLDSQPAANSP